MECHEAETRPLEQVLFCPGLMDLRPRPGEANPVSRQLELGLPQG
jgi:hypothetical protein